ncbi:hypothetical protein QFC21_005639 [Naganishia friedmannii]|uniref:Uncharacterized protein n=1 Tax=Naganishia friedmannii TaxID=89922 RepID=A0ACC2V7D3_9TREE|nr:hypothetical protein QFC21_005639 [Naganishia friedmannii]
MIFTDILQCIALFGGLISRVAAVPTLNPCLHIENVPSSLLAAALAPRAECTTKDMTWPWSTRDAIQDVINVDQANIKLKLSPEVKAFSLILAQLARGYILNDNLDDPDVMAWNDCDFRDKVELTMELFAVKDNCINIAITKKNVMAENEDQGHRNLTLAPIFYESWYQSMRANQRFSDLWCNGHQTACSFANARAFFSHTTHLQLKEANVGSLPSDELQKVFDGVNRQSPVMLKTADSIAIITAADKGSESWTGFDISDPRSIKTWTKAETMQMLVAYAESHEPLPLGMPPKECSSPVT